MSEQNLDEDIMPPSYNSVRSLMHRARRQDQPQIPRRRQDIDLSGDYSLTLDQQQFLLYQDANLLIFATEPNLQLLSNAATFYMDSTFKASPQIFGAPPARRMKYVRIDEEVQRLTQRFDSDDITAMDYICRIKTSHSSLLINYILCIFCFLYVYCKIDKLCIYFLYIII